MKSSLPLVLFAALLTVPLASQARQEPPRSPRIANYTLAATLDPTSRRLTGTGRIRWRNATSTPASELRLHLYWNAWRDAASKTRFIAPDDGNPEAWTDQFHAAGPDEFFTIVNEVGGQDLTWFFDEVHRRAARFDYGVAHVQSVGDHITSTVMVRRFGDGVFPIDVKVTFADGRETTERWDGRAPWRAFTFERPGAVSSVDVDPSRVLLLDTNYTNNSWTAAPRAAEAATRWSWRWLTWAQELLLTYAFFA